MVLVSLSPNGACDGTALADLGQLLFFDPNLSSERTQSCATCHDPSAAFVDPRDNAVRRAASLGDDGQSIGDRNTPSAGYASHTPNFTRNLDGEYVGGWMFTDHADEIGTTRGFMESIGDADTPVGVDAWLSVSTSTGRWAPEPNVSITRLP